MHDTKKGALRYYTYGAPFFNYGMLPQTWEDPALKGDNGTGGDNDPLDVMEIGSRIYKVGEMRQVKVIGDIKLIDQGELDHKIIVIDAADPLASAINSAADLARVMPGVTEKLIEWLKQYKTTDGKEVTSYQPPAVLYRAFSSTSRAACNPSPLPLALTSLPTCGACHSCVTLAPVWQVNVLVSDSISTTAVAMGVIAECHKSWTSLKARGAGDTGFWLK